MLFEKAGAKGCMHLSIPHINYESAVDYPNGVPERMLIKVTADYKGKLCPHSYVRVKDDAPPAALGSLKALRKQTMQVLLDGGKLVFRSSTDIFGKLLPTRDQVIM